MSEVKIYSTQSCPYCTAAKGFFQRKGIEPIEIDLTNEPEKLASLKKETGWMTVPQIFINGDFVGGDDDVQELHRKGVLDSKLGI